MGKNRVISDSDLKKLGEEFQSSKESIDAISTSLDNMRASLLNEVYDGCAKYKMMVDFNKLKKESQNLSYVYNALNMFTASVTKAFVKSDNNASEGAKSNITQIDRSEK